MSSASLPPSLESPPKAVLPGDDLTRFVMNPSCMPSSSLPSRKNKKARQSNGANTAACENDDGDDPSSLHVPKIGTGLRYDPISRSVVAAVAGRLVYRPSSRTWHVASNPRRYQPSVGDRVVGIVEDKASADFYRVHIGGAHPALLNVLSFEGATKRNRPYLEAGSLIYCRVSRVHGGGGMDPEVTCKGGCSSDCGGSDDGGASRKDWMTDEGTYGELKGGTVARIGLGLARELLLPSNVVLAALDQSGVPFELAVGVNGMLWVHSTEPEYTITIVNAIKNSEVMTPEQVRGMVKALVKTVRADLEED